MYRFVGGKELTFFPKIWEKKFQSALLNTPGRPTGNNVLFKGGLNISTTHSHTAGLSLLYVPTEVVSGPYIQGLYFLP